VLRKTALLLWCCLCALCRVSWPTASPERSANPATEWAGSRGTTHLASAYTEGNGEAGNEQRQAELKRDAERLLKLSTELKEYVDKSNENVLSLDVLKKADEIEKLAHSVKTKMRGSN